MTISNYIICHGIKWIKKLLLFISIFPSSCPERPGSLWNADLGMLYYDIGLFMQNLPLNDVEAFLKKSLRTIFTLKAKFSDSFWQKIHAKKSNFISDWLQGQNVFMVWQGRQFAILLCWKKIDIGRQKLFKIPKSVVFTSLCIFSLGVNNLIPAKILHTLPTLTWKFYLEVNIMPDTWLTNLFSFLPSLGGKGNRRGDTKVKQIFKQFWTTDRN